MPDSNASSRTRKAEPEKQQGLALDRAPSGTIDLVFGNIDRLGQVEDAIWEDISSLAVVGRSIFCTCDETSTIERVLYDESTGRAESHANFVLGETFDLPDGAGGEMDIEGLAIADGYLWICGSHSLKRDDPGDGGLDDLKDIDWDPNRAFLGKVPLVDRGDGVFDLFGAFEPLNSTEPRHARMVKLGKKREKSPIYELLKEDPLIGPFVDLPCKENGLDIEGLAVRGDTVLLGLRGPVLGKQAIIVRLDMKVTKHGHLKPAKLENDQHYQLQAIDLGGQAIRDLHWQEDRLLILTGATTDLEAMQSVVAIEDYDPERSIYSAASVRRVLDLPTIRGSDHAEGLAPITIDGEEKLLVAYDSPHDDRLDRKNRRLTSDLFDLADDTRLSSAKRTGRQSEASQSKKHG